LDLSGRCFKGPRCDNVRESVEASVERHATHLLPTILVSKPKRSITRFHIFPQWLQRFRLQMGIEILKEILQKLDAMILIQHVTLESQKILSLSKTKKTLYFRLFCHHLNCQVPQSNLQCLSLQKACSLHHLWQWSIPHQHQSLQKDLKLALDPKPKPKRVARTRTTASRSQRNWVLQYLTQQSWS